MTIEKLREAYSTEPFVPFTISLADGRQFRIRSREFLLIPPKAQRTFVVVDGDDSFSVVDLFLVSSLDYSGLKGRPSNGRHRK
jgi:hypothetical protein